MHFFRNKSKDHYPVLKKNQIGELYNSNDTFSTYSLIILIINCLRLFYKKTLEKDFFGVGSVSAPFQYLAGTFSFGGGVHVIPFHFFYCYFKNFL